MNIMSNPNVPLDVRTALADTALALAAAKVEFTVQVNASYASQAAHDAGAAYEAAEEAFEAMVKAAAFYAK